MAYSPSPQRSPTMATSTARLIDQNFTPTPPPIPLSKRDKRRSALSEKLNELTASFSQNRDSHYRQQLSALQIDMTLIMRADPYADSPLDDSGEDITDMIVAAMGATAQTAPNGAGAGQPEQRRPEIDAGGLAGRWYSKFVEDVNNAAENRDAALTMLENNYERTLHELHHTNRYKIKLAQEEHRQLSRTIRERLIQSLMNKKTRLMREKEQLDIADSNALLLHPSQFSITNPASPSNAASNRKTRHTRHRPAEMDDVGAGVSGGDGSHKRKKKGALDDNDESPAPPGRALDTGTSSPYHDAKARLIASQVDAPLYSIDRLFTDKELAMHLNQANVAAHNYFADLKNQSHSDHVSGNKSAAKAEDEEASASNDAGATQDADGYDNEAAAAPEMDRVANQSHHTTRSTRGNGGAASALNVLGDLAAASEKTGAGMASSSLLPIILPSSFITKTGMAPAPPSLRMEEAEDDLAKLDRLMRAPPGVTDTKLLDELCAPLGSANFHAAAGTRMASAAGGVPMSAQSSMGATGGFNDIGGVPMTRYGEGSSTGAMMKRSASGAGFNGGEGKRARNR